jgi:flagellar biosynthesis protein FlhG
MRSPDAIALPTTAAQIIPRSMAVASGKGGVGKTSLAVNIAIAAARRGQRCLLVDADGGSANAAMVIGQRPRRTIADVIGGTCAMDEAVMRGIHGIDMLAGHSGSGVGTLASAGERARLTAALNRVAADYDFIVVDLPAGNSAAVTSLVALCTRLLLVVTPEPTSFLDAFALCKAIAATSALPQPPISVATNMCAHAPLGQRLFEEFNRVAGQFLDAPLGHAGWIPDDPAMRRAIMAKRPCVVDQPLSAAARAVSRMAATLTATTTILPQTEARHGC